MKELSSIQNELDAPKTQEVKNNRGQVMYKYRSCEDILKAMKPLLKKYKVSIKLTDDIFAVGNRIYVKAVATITNEAGETESTSAFAREPDALGGMSPSQVTGTASSYARKYALDGLLAIGDGADADEIARATEAQQAGSAPFPPPQNAQQAADQVKKEELLNAYALPAIQQANTKEELLRVWNDYPTLQGMSPFMKAMSERKKIVGLKK